MIWDIFLSYAREDRDFATQLYHALEKRGLSVWFEDVQIKVAETLSEGYEYGLANSQFVLLLLSREYLAGSRDRVDLNYLLSGQDKEDHIIIPVLHGATRDEVASFWPQLNSILVPTPGLTVPLLADLILTSIFKHSSEILAVEDRSVSVFIDPGDASAELLTELYVSLAAYYRSLGGSGLVIKKDERRSIIGEVV